MKRTLPVRRTMRASRIMSAVPETSAEAMNSGAMIAEYQKPRAICRPKIQAVMECSRIAAGRPDGREHALEPLVAPRVREGRAGAEREPAAARGEVRPRVHPHVRRRDEEVHGDDGEVPDQRRREVRVAEQVPGAVRAADVGQQEQRGDHDRHGRLQHGDAHHGLELRRAEEPAGGGDDQSAGREAHEVHEHGDVQAPHHGVAHVGGGQPVGELVDPGAEPHGDPEHEERRSRCAGRAAREPSAGAAAGVTTVLMCPAPSCGAAAGSRRAGRCRAPRGAARRRARG